MFLVVCNLYRGDFDTYLNPMGLIEGTQKLECDPFLFYSAHKWLGADSVIQVVPNILSLLASLRAHLQGDFDIYLNPMGLIESTQKLECDPFLFYCGHKWPGTDSVIQVVPNILPEKQCRLVRKLSKENIFKSSID